MLMYVRDLMLGMLAWICGNWAMSSFPVSPSLSYEKWSDIVTLFLYRPTRLLLAAVLFGAACFILHKLLVTHGIQLLQRNAFSHSDWYLHALVLMFALYVSYIQLVKMPLPTLAVLAITVLVHAHTWFRRRAF